MNHSHILYDSDPHFKIDPISRKITNESSTKTTIIQHDHNSERFTFEVPRYVEGHDLSLCNIVEVHYLNIEANSKRVRNGVYTVDDLHVKEGDENTVVCSWLITDNATQFVGQLQFLIRFSCAQADTGTVDYVWNTGIYSSISVSLGIYNSETPSDNRQPAFNFVTTIGGQTLKFFVGTQAEYDAIRVKDPKTVYYITDETLLDDILSGLIKVGYAKEADHANEADYATEADKANKANKADHANEASHAKAWVVASLSGLKEMIQINPLSSIAINIIAEGGETGIKIPTTTGDVYIPNNADGTLTVGDGSASLHLTTYTGEVFHLFYNGNGDTWVKGIINAVNATNATNDSNGQRIDTTYGNFAREWTTWVRSNEPKPQLQNGAVYLLDCEWQNSTGHFMHHSTIVHFEGSEISYILDYRMQGTLFDFSFVEIARLKIDSSGTPSVCVERRNNDAFEEHLETMENALFHIKLKRIWG